MLARGSRVVLTSQGLLLGQDGLDHEMSPGYGPSLALGKRALDLDGYVNMYDVSVTGDRVVALCDGPSTDCTLAITTLGLASSDSHSVSKTIERVAITGAHVFVAAYDEVRIHGGARVHAAPVDLAATLDELAVLDAHGVTFFDARGKRTGDVPLFAPTVIAVDRVEAGWLVAIDAGVFHIAGPGSTPRLLASVAEPVKKVRRSAEAIYVQVGTEVRKIVGDHVEAAGSAIAVGWHWSDFDAGPEGFELYTN